MTIQMLTHPSTQKFFTPTFADAPQTNLPTANLDAFLMGHSRESSAPPHGWGENPVYSLDPRFHGDDNPFFGNAFKKFEASHPLAARMFGKDTMFATLILAGFALMPSGGKGDAPTEGGTFCGQPVVPTPRSAVITRGGRTMVLPNVDVTGLFAYEITERHEGIDQAVLRKRLEGLLKEWADIPPAKKQGILNAELQEASLPQLVPAAAQDTISFRWVEERLNGAPFLSAAAARRHPVRDILRGPARLGNMKIPAPRRELHPFLLDEKGDLKQFYDIGSLREELISHRITLKEVHDPRTADGYVFSYTNAFGDTIVIIRSELLSADGRVAQGSIAGFANGTARLPYGEYHDIEVRYTFNGIGIHTGIEVVRDTLVTKEFNSTDPKNWTVHHGDYVFTDRLASYEDPGPKLSMAERREFVAAVADAAREAAELEDTGKALAESSVRTAMEDWSRLSPDVQAQIRHLDSINRDRYGPHTAERVKTFDHIPIAWVKERATAYINGTAGPIFETRLGEHGLEVKNASVVLSLGWNNFSRRDIFSLGGKGFPPRELAYHLTMLFNRRPGMEDLTHGRLYDAVRSALNDDFSGGFDVFRGKEMAEVRDGIDITVNGERMRLDLAGIEMDVRRHLFGPNRPIHYGFRGRLDDALAWLKDTFSPVKLPDAVRLERIPRNGLPELAMDIDGNLRSYSSLRELEAALIRREGPANIDEKGESLAGRLQNGEALAAWRSWSWIAEWHELREGAGAAEYLDAARTFGWDNQQFPNTYFRYVVTLHNDGVSSMNVEYQREPVNGYDVRYFFDKDGLRVATMIIKRKYVAGYSGGVNFGFTVPVEEKSAAKTVLTQFAPSVAGTIDANRCDTIVRVVQGMFTWENDEQKAADMPRIRAAAVQALRAWQRSKESRPATATTSPLDWIKLAALDILGVPEENRPDARVYNRYSPMDRQELTLFNTGRANIMIGTIEQGGGGVRMLTPRLTTKRGALDNDRPLCPMGECAKGTEAGEQTDTPKAIADARTGLLRLFQNRAASGTAPLVSADALARFKGYISEAMGCFGRGEYNGAFNAFEKLAALIVSTPDFGGETPVARTLKWLKASVHEAAGDMAVLLGRDSARAGHYNLAYSTAQGSAHGYTTYALATRMTEAVGDDGRQAVEDIWREVGPDWLLRDPIAALEGGVAKQGGGDVIPPPECARLDAASVARITRETAKTRREILEAHREARKAAERSEKK